MLLSTYTYTRGGSREVKSLVASHEGHQCVHRWWHSVIIIFSVTLIWNTVKLWCRKNEREAMRRPGVIAYLTEDEAITAPGHGRLAEVPLERLHELSIALSVKKGQIDRVSNLFLARKYSAS